MNIWEADKLVLFIAFVIPGFISLKAYSMLVPSEQKDSGGKLIDAIAYSCINYALLSPLILYVESNNVLQDSPNWRLLYVCFVLFIFPVTLSVLWLLIRRTRYILKIAPHPILKPWDYLFSKRESYWIKVTLKSGEVIGGKYHDKSFASSFPAQEQIYLEESWIIDKEDGGFKRPKNRSEGVMVMSEELAYVELFKYKED